MAGSNRANGTSFEHELYAALSLHGFWAHNLAQNRQGQPFDVIAARNRKTYAIDCKQCKKDRFPLSRVEGNQRSSMILWEDTGNGDGWFALEMSDGEVVNDLPQPAPVDFDCMTPPFTSERLWTSCYERTTGS